MFFDFWRTTYWFKCWCFYLIDWKAANQKPPVLKKRLSKIKVWFGLTSFLLLVKKICMHLPKEVSSMTSLNRDASSILLKLINNLLNSCFKLSMVAAFLLRDCSYCHFILSASFTSAFLDSTRCWELKKNSWNFYNNKISRNWFIAQIPEYYKKKIVKFQKLAKMKLYL